MEYSLLKIYSRLLFPNIKLFGITSTRHFAAKPAVKGRGGTTLPADQEESYVEEDAAKLCKYVCVNYKNEDDSPGPEIRPNSEYPSWIFQLDIEPNKELEDMDPERDGWKYWEKWEQRRLDQIHLHNKLRTQFFWLQDSPSVDMILAYSKFRGKFGKFHVVPNTTPIYRKSTRKRELNSMRWTSVEESENLYENNG
ncbi:hypothetical protein ACQ4LE_001716 [Meloidogyne hapla]|uniref:39S ribosomal protein L54, mitochondrial n=1 Tax=Meloidogyne hapla TaxID=6305 RepID=A0A1I8BAZ9_MELHA